MDFKEWVWNIQMLVILQAYYTVALMVHTIYYVKIEKWLTSNLCNYYGENIYSAVKTSFPELILDSRIILHGSQSTHPITHQVWHNGAKVIFILLLYFFVELLSFFNFGWMLAQETSKSEFLRSCQFFKEANETKW